MIEYTCECGKTYQLAEEMVGKKVRCPVCDRTEWIAMPNEDDAELEQGPKHAPKPSLSRWANLSLSVRIALAILGTALITFSTIAITRSVPFISVIPASIFLGLSFSFLSVFGWRQSPVKSLLSVLSAFGWRQSPMKSLPSLWANLSLAPRIILTYLGILLTMFSITAIARLVPLVNPRPASIFFFLFLLFMSVFGWRQSPVQSLLRFWKKKPRWGKITIIIVASLAFVGSFLPDTGSEIYAEDAAKEIMLKRLVAPSTANFVEVRATRLSTYEDGKMVDLNLFSVLVVLDAENSFGAMIRTRSWLEVIYLGPESGWRLINIRELN